MLPAHPAAVEALIGLLKDEKIATDEVERIEVATYRIAAEHAETGWDDFASAQLGFPYLMGLALRFRASSSSISPRRCGAIPPSPRSPASSR